MNRITTKKGVRIVLDHVVGYEGWPHEEGDSFKISIFMRDKTDELVTFEDEEDRNAFLARLDSYFEEIP